MPSVASTGIETPTSTSMLQRIEDVPTGPNLIVGKSKGIQTEELSQLESPHAKQDYKSWSNLFTENKLAERGMELNYIAPIIMAGEKVAQLPRKG